jgi:hypothetical protein
LLSKAKIRTSRAIKALQSFLINIWLDKRTASQVIFNTWWKNLQSILLFSNISINPITGLQVIFVHTWAKIDQTFCNLRWKLVRHFSTVRIQDIWDDCKVIFLPLNLKTHLSSSCAILTIYNLIFKKVKAFLNLFDFLKQRISLLRGETGRVARGEVER